MAEDSATHEAMRQAAVGNADGQHHAHELAVQYRNIDSLIPYINNARTHSDEQVAQIAASIKEFGWTNPVLVDGDNGIIAGHGRVLAARKLEATEIPVIELQGLSEAQRRAYILADNRLAQNAGWDRDLLALELTELDNADFDLSLLGFEPGELKDLLADEPKEGLTDPDEVPEPPAEAVTQPGDLWILGEHRLLCGDSTDAESVAYLMDGAKADMVFTDPPYGMRLDTDWSDAKSSLKFASEKNALGGKKHKTVIGDHNDFSPELISAITDIDAKEMFIWGADYFAELLPERNDGSLVVWDKRLDESADKMYGSTFELCWSRNRHKRETARIKWAGIFGTEKEFDHKRHHPTQKPALLVEWFFDKWGSAGDLVVDLYLGSGTTLIAAERLSRKCYGLEIDPIYCDVIIKRWQKFTGQEAVLKSTGDKYNDMFINGEKPDASTST